LFTAFALLTLLTLLAKGARKAVNPIPTRRTRWAVFAVLEFVKPRKNDSFDPRTS
jgi:hypothetical protein